MVHLFPVPEPSDDRPLGARERNRLARHRSYLRAALHLVFEDGLEALTMQRLADAVGASVGSVYTYFPSKGALVAEVQREAIERLAASALVLGTDIERAARTVPDDVAMLAAVVGLGRFLLTVGDTYPEEMQLQLRLLSTATESVPDDEAARVVPAAMRFLGLADHALARAAAAGVLAAGDAGRRTIAIAASLTGCVQLAVVQQWDEDLLDPVAIGRTVLDGLLLGWGADADALAAAHLVIDRLEADGPLARPIPEGSTS